MQVPESDFKVLVRCFTFNHSKFIETTMDGFVMQQTDFSYVCCIVDDCSTDGEQEVILSYINNQFDTIQQRETEDATILFARHKSNKNCSFEVHFLKYNHYSSRKPKAPYLAHWKAQVKYESLCEGDDYWIDPRKLQRQYEFMESNPDYILCGTNGIVLWDLGQKAPTYFCKRFKDQELSAQDIIGKWCMPTASLFFRICLYERLSDFKCQIYSGDLKLLLTAMANGRIWIFGFASVVYRRNQSETGITNMVNRKKDHSTFYFDNIAKLYSEYDRYTNGRYSEVINRYLKQCNQLRRMAKIKKYIGILSILVYPQTAYKMIFMNKLKNLVWSNDSFKFFS